MSRPKLSRQAACLVRALLARAGEGHERILLSDCQSTEWRSLTMEGERHELLFRVADPADHRLLATLTTRLEEAEFAIPGLIVADIASCGSLEHANCVAIEALTIRE
jgi:hypothetical protein